MNNNNLKKTVACTLALTVIMGLTAGTLKLKKDSPYSEMPIEYSDNATTADIKNDEFIVETDETTVTNINDESNNLDIYTEQEQLKIETKERIKELCNNNNYDSKVEIYLNTLLNKIIDNYDLHYSVNKNMGIPDKENFVNNYINNLSTNKTSIKIIDENDSKYTDMLGYANGCYYFEANQILVMDFGNDDQIVETLMEEITHSFQKDWLNITNENGNNIGLYYTLVEGEPANNKYLLNNVIVSGDGSFYREYENYGYYVSCCELGNDAIHSKYYRILCDLVGYDNMEKSKENFDLNYLKSIIETKYDADVNKLFDCINRCDEINIVDVCTVEEIYCDCLTQELNNLSSKEEVSNFFNEYRLYKLEYGIKCLKEIDNGNENYEYIDYTKTRVKGYEQIESLLLKKVKEYNIIEGEHDEVIFNSLLSTDNNYNQEISINDCSMCEANDNIYISGQNSNEVYQYNLKTSEVNIIEKTNYINNNSIRIIDGSVELTK